MLFPDYKNVTSVTLTTNTNPSYTVTQPCMVLINGSSSVSNANGRTMYCAIDGVNVNNLLSAVGDVAEGDRVTLFLNTGSTISVSLSGYNRQATIRIIPLTTMGGGGCNDVFEEVA